MAHCFNVQAGCATTCSCRCGWCAADRLAFAFTLGGPLPRVSDGVPSALDTELARLREQLAAATKRAEEAEDLLRAVAAYCRGLGPRTDEAASVLGHVERDPEAAAIKARVARLEEVLREIAAFVGRLRGGDRPGPTEVLVHWNRARAALADEKGTTPCSGCGGSGNAVCGACNDSCFEPEAVR